MNHVSNFPRVILIQKNCHRNTKQKNILTSIIFIPNNNNNLIFNNAF